MKYPGRAPNHFPQTPLQAYGNHHQDCLIYSRLVTSVCSCGFSEAIAADYSLLQSSAASQGDEE